MMERRVKIFLFILLSFHYINSNMIKIPFKITNIYKDKDIFEDHFRNTFSIDISIGTPEQKFEINLSQESFFFWIVDKTANYSSSSTYDYDASSTKSGSYTFEREINEPMLKRGKKVEDILQINGNNYGTQEFITATQIEGLKKGSGVIGLDIGTQIIGVEPEYNFIQSLRDKGNITNFSYSIQFEGDNKGYLIIGEYPHERKEHEWFQTKESFKPFLTQSYNKNVKWGLAVPSVKGFDGISVESNVSGVFDFESGFFIGSRQYYNHIYEYFFKNTINNGQCQKHIYNGEESSVSYTYFTCRDKDAFKNFEPLIFYIEENIEYKFKAEELFVFDNTFSEYIFMVVFKEDVVDYWTFGELFLRKYEIVFDQNRKIIGAYHYDKKGNKGKSRVLMFVIIILIIGIAAFSYFYFSVRKRRLRINFEGEFSQLNFGY